MESEGKKVAWPERFFTPEPVYVDKRIMTFL